MPTTDDYDKAEEQRHNRQNNMERHERWATIQIIVGGVIIIVAAVLIVILLTGFPHGWMP